MISNKLDSRQSGGQEDAASEQVKSDADRLYASQKPLHNLPRGKNTWNPEFLKIWWFWPASVAFIIVLAYVYPFIWDFFSGN
jgi:hypothetical protein